MTKTEVRFFLTEILAIGIFTIILVGMKSADFNPILTIYSSLFGFGLTIHICFRIFPEVKQLVLEAFQRGPTPHEWEKLMEDAFSEKKDDNLNGRSTS